MIQPILSFLLALGTSVASPSTPDVPLLSEPTQIALLQAHYAAAVADIQAEDTSMLTSEQRYERARLLSVLSDFGACGDFGHNPDYAGALMPYFRDADGRRCAVAELMHASGEDAFVESVRVARNHAWICELEGDPQFTRWLDRAGLTIEDAVRIQGPPILVEPQRAHLGTGTYNGPGDTLPGASSPARPSGPASGGASPAGTTSAPSGPGTSAPTGIGAATGTKGMPTPVTLTMTSDDTWWLWWEYNKAEFLRPNPLTLEGLTVTGDDLATATRKVIEAARKRAQPIFEKGLRDTDAQIRATSAIALGRSGAAANVEMLLTLLEDPNLEVRHQAILALGATGKAEAVLPLLSIARTGNISADKRSTISPAARALAIVALGIGRKHDFDDRIDVEIAKLIQNRTQTDREMIGVAALVYQLLAPCEELKRYALSMAKDDTESPSVRCRAVEALRHGNDTETLAELQHFLCGPRLDLRRSASLALGDFQSPLVVPALIVAYELEAEPLTRGFTLMSIGRQGGDRARAYLLKVLDKGEGAMRRWAALALGIDARRLTNPETLAKVTKAIREAQQREKNQDGMGAYWLALGLSRDEFSRTTLRTALGGSGDGRQRMYAATGLALLGGEASLAALRERMAVETQSLVRVAIAQSIGVFGRTQDVPAMMDMLSRLSEPYLQGLAAYAMASLGSGDSLRALDELARLDNGSNVRRAAAIEGLGMMLAPNPPLIMADVSREANYTVFAEWVSGMFQTTL